MDHTIAVGIRAPARILPDETTLLKYFLRTEGGTRFKYFFCQAEQILLPYFFKCDTDGDVNYACGEVSVFIPHFIIIFRMV